MHLPKRKVWEEVLQQEQELLCLEPDLAMASEQLVSTGVATCQIQILLLGLVVVLVVLVLILLLLFLALVLFLLVLFLLVLFLLVLFLLVLVLLLVLLLLLILLVVLLLFLSRALALGLDPHPSFYAICDDFSS